MEDSIVCELLLSWQQPYHLAPVLSTAVGVYEEDFASVRFSWATVCLWGALSHVRGQIHFHVSVYTMYVVVHLRGHHGTCKHELYICDRVWEKGTFRAKIEFLISGTRG